jgi:hypothetical protein
MIRSFRRPGKVLVAATFAILLAIPAPAVACCRVAKTANLDPPACCRTPGHHSNGQFAAEGSTCVSAHSACKCLCCQVANQQTIPATNSQNRGQLELTPVFTAIPAFFFPADATAGIASEQIVALGAGVPHRILHCSWII